MNRISMDEKKPTEPGLYDVFYVSGKQGKGLWCMKDGGYWNTLTGVRVTHYLPKETIVRPIEPPKKPFRHNKRGKIPLTDVLNEVASYYEISKDCILSKCRARSYVIPRHVCAYLHRYFGYGLHETARFFSLDHTSIVNAEKKITLAMRDSIQMSADIEYLTSVLLEKVNKAA